MTAALGRCPDHSQAEPIPGRRTRAPALHRPGPQVGVTGPSSFRLRRRYRSWWAPTLALTAFTALFLFSSLVIGPLISNPGEAASTQPGDIDHAVHHD